MKKHKLSIILLSSFLLFLAFPQSSDLFSHSSYTQDNLNSYSDDNTIELKSSSWNVEFIDINDNWTETMNEYAWLSVGDGTETNPYIIENIIINSGTSNSGIYIINSADHFIIRNCDITNVASGSSTAGIHLRDTGNGTITNNVIYNTQGRGIHVHGSDNVTISNNIIEDNPFEGMYIVQLCYYNNISSNYISGNKMGIYFASAGVKYSTIRDNVICNNLDYGIRIDASDYNVIKNNFIYDNTIGIDVSISCDNNSIRLNSISEGFGKTANDRSGSINNYNNTLFGNYWSDYTGSDDNHNGIGDTPHDIPGGGCRDYKPLMNRDTYFWEKPEDLSHEVGLTGYSLKWTVIDISPYIKKYEIKRNGTLIETGEPLTQMSEIEITLPTLGAGIHEYQIEIEDGSGKMCSDLVQVEVTNAAPQFAFKPSDLSFEEGSSKNNISWMFSDISTNNPTFSLIKDGVTIISTNSCVAGQWINIYINDLDAGTHVYQITISDGHGKSISNIVIVTVTNFLEENSILILAISIIVGLLLAAILHGKIVRKRIDHDKPTQKDKEKMKTAQNPKAPKKAPQTTKTAQTSKTTKNTRKR